LNAAVEVGDDPLGSYWAALRNHWSAAYFAQAIEWVNNAPSAAQVISDGRFLLRVMHRPDDRFMIACWNLSVEPARETVIRLANPLAEQTWQLVDADGQLHKVPVEAGENGSRLVLRDPLLPMAGCFLVSAARTGA
jgi:hypothetical protein